MKKRLITAAFAAVFLSVLLISCAYVGQGVSYHILAPEEASLAVSFSNDGESFTPLTEQAKVFHKRIYAAADYETVYLSVENTGEEYVYFSLSVIAAGGIAPPTGLFYCYGKGETPDIPVGSEGSEAFLLSPDESVSLAVKVGSAEDDMGVVAPTLGLSFCAERQSFAFDPASDESFTLLSGEAVRDKIPSDTERVVFTDALYPRGMTTVDLSAAQNGAVLGWQEGKSFYISTRLSGRRVMTGDNASYLLSDLKSLKSVSFSMLDTSKTRDFMRFLSGCAKLVEADLSSLDTRSAVRLRSMLNGCSSLSSASVSGWDVSAVKDVAYLFAGTSALTSLDLSAWDLSEALYTTAMLQSSGVKQLSLPEALPEIGTYFFNHVQKYEGTSFTVPSSVTYIGRAHTFYNFGTNAFSEFIVADGSTAARAVDGVLYSADGTALLAVPVGKQFENGVFEIAEGTTLLGELSFSRNTSIQTVVLPSSYRVKVYTEIYHPDFAEPSKREGDTAKTGNINTGNSLNLAIYAYTSVSAYAVKEDHPYYVSVDGVLYEKDASGNAGTLVAVPLGYTGALVIPEGVTRIEDEAFWEDEGVLFSGITEIRLPSTLTDFADGQLEKIESLGIPILYAD